MRPPELQLSILDAETVARRRRAIGWTCEHERASTPGMTLLIATRTQSGELVIAADRRTSVPTGEDNDEKIIIDDISPKLIDFNGAVIGVVGKCSPALRVVRQFVAEDVRDANSCDRLARRLVSFYGEWYPGDREKWPGVQVTYCDWLGGRGRMLRLSSSDGFTPEDLDISVHTSGNGGMSIATYQFFGCGATAAHAERFCVLSLALTAALYTNVGGASDVWTLSRAGLSKRTQEEVQDILSSVKESLTGVRERLYP